MLASAYLPCVRVCLLEYLSSQETLAYFLSILSLSLSLSLHTTVFVFVFSHVLSVHFFVFFFGMDVAAVVVAVGMKNSLRYERKETRERGSWRIEGRVWFVHK